MSEHAQELAKLSVEQLAQLKEQYEAQREIYCQEYLVYANKVVENMENPTERDYWDAKIKDLEGATQKYKHLIMDVIVQMTGMKSGAGNVEPGKETTK